MNYKYLSKYHHLYRLSIGGDSKAHVEKLAIAYANRHYIYVIIPGADELKKLDIGFSIYCSRPNVFMSLDPIVQNSIIGMIEKATQSKAFYFILDDPKPLKEFADGISSTSLRRQYLEREKELTLKKLQGCKKQWDAANSELARLNYELSKLQKDTKESTGLPEGVTLG